MVAMLPKLQDESGECDVTTQNQDVVKLPFSIDYYSEFFNFRWFGGLVREGLCRCISILDYILPIFCIILNGSNY